MSDKLAFIHQLRDQVSGEVLDDSYSLGMYATDASVYRITPEVIVLPKSEVDVKVALKLAQQYGLTVLPRGGGTSLAGQTVGKSMVLDFSKYLNQIIEINAEEKWAWVQPGIARDDLNAILKAYNLHFAPDPATSSRANVGGMIGNNSSGTKSILYGKTVDHVLELEVLLADGTELHLKPLSEKEYQLIAQQDDKQGVLYQEFKTLIQENREEIKSRFPKVMRRVGGYNLDEFIDTDTWNLSKLFCGSEGTLGLTLKAKINLELLPAFKSVCVAHFKEVLEAIQAVKVMLPFRPAAIEILDHTVVSLSKQNLETQPKTHFIEGEPAAILIVEFYDEQEVAVMQRPQQMVEKLREVGLGYSYPLFPEGPAYEDVWAIRKKGLGLMLGIKGNKKPLPFIEDAGIPTEVLPEYIEKALQVCSDNQTEVAMYAHASVGVIHLRPILDLRLEEDVKRFKAIAEQTFDLVKAYGGSWSGEHGDGLVRSPFNEAYFGSQLYGVFKKVKALFDPENRMNPGKIVDAPDMTQNLRYGAEYQEKVPATVYQYRSDEGFSESVHMCTGVGECRKMLGGTMCPSFKVTRDEEQSTRGRANALRLAMSGQLGEAALSSERLQDAMDLCLSCKACKSECPSNVDMAKLKAEVRQHYYDAHGYSTRDRAIRDSPQAARRFAGRLATAINRIQGSSWFRTALEKRLGFDRRRSLPAYASQPFTAWYRKNRKTPVNPEGKELVLFVDTYLNFFEPSVGKAALSLLEACGYQVILADVGCCQRPAISHGFLRDAKRRAHPMLLKLDTFLRKGWPVVVCEPSCASALTDDLADLVESEGLAERLKNQVYMIDQFLAKEAQEGRVSLMQLRSKHTHLTLHGHCHQKALFGTQSMHRILQEIPDLHCSEVDSGCCGMAGSFGYEKEHYDLSQKMGERVLFPAIREGATDTTVIACGFSCRHQIEHFTGKKAIHWVEVFESGV